MTYKNGNYAAFYVDEPFREAPLGAPSPKDFVYYNQLRTWKEKDTNFPFIDCHNGNYNVRDSIEWSSILKPRLHQLLQQAKNLVLFLSENTQRSQALWEEINYGINKLGLPVIVIYPDYKNKESLLSNNSLKYEIKNLWNNLPIFKDSMNKIPTLHIPMQQEMIKLALENKGYMVNSKKPPGIYFYKV